ncbi:MULTISPECIES: sialidase family protein [unclassified Microbacterium]|uniref:sialidase family protein n=1 Tax=Microbacterium TaxID=33882 RepID=UPI003BA07803
MADVVPQIDGVLTRRDDRYEALIPTERAENHASFLHRLPDGSLAAVWFAGEREGLPDVRIQMSRLDESAGRWSPAIAVSPRSEQSHQNPVLATLPDGAVWLLYTAQELGAQDTAVLMRRVSRDGGATWGDPEPLIEDRGVFIRQDLVVLPDGTLLLPIFRCHPLPGRQWFGDGDESSVLRSEDGGATWTEVPVPDSVGAVHMDIVPFEDGGLVAFFRSRWADAVYRSESPDSGRTWTRPEVTEVPNNNSSIQMRRAPHLGADSVLAVLNPVAAAPGRERIEAGRAHDAGKVTAPGTPQPLDRYAVWGVERTPVSLLRSDDRGRTWTKVVDIDTAADIPPAMLERAGDRAGELSYPALVVTADGDVHVSYSYCRAAIKHVLLPREVVGAQR